MKKLLALATLFTLFGCAASRAQNVSRMINGVTTYTSGSPKSLTCAESLKLIIINSSSAYTANLPTASTCGAGTVFQVKNIGAGLLTLGTASGTIDGASSISVLTNQGIDAYDDGSNYSTQAGSDHSLRSCDIVVGDTTASSDITTNQLGPQIKLCYIPFAATILEFSVSANAGTPKVKVAVRHSGTPTTITTNELQTASAGATACANTAGSGTGYDGTTCAIALTVTTIAAGDYIELLSGTTSTGAKLMTIHVVYRVI